MSFLFLDKTQEYKSIKQIIFAEKLLLEEQIYPLYLKSSGPRNPSLTLFIQLGKQGLPAIRKLLADQTSSFHRESGLRILSSPEFPFYKELESLVIGLLSDKDLELRRSAYLTLLRSKAPFNELINATSSASESVRFYASRVMLNTEVHEPMRTRQYTCTRDKFNLYIL